jgi:hypothetical protein
MVAILFGTCFFRLMIQIDRQRILRPRNGPENCNISVAPGVAGHLPTVVGPVPVLQAVMATQGQLDPTQEPIYGTKTRTASPARDERRRYVVRPFQGLNKLDARTATSRRVPD